MVAALTTRAESRPLDFHDILTLDEKARYQAARALESIICNAFATLDPSWATPYYRHRPEAENIIRQWHINTIEPLLDGNQAVSDYYLDFAIHIVDHIYNMLDGEHLIAAAKASAMLAPLDDMIEKDPQLRKEFECLCRNIRSGHPSKIPILNAWRDAIAEHASFHSDPLVDDYVWWSWLTFVVGANMESTTDQLLPALQISLDQAGRTRPDFAASDLPYFIRFKSGASEPIILTSLAQNGDRVIPRDMWLPMMPDAVLFLNLVNDVLSTPKELIKGDNATYPIYLTYAKRQINATGSGADGKWCFEDTFVEICDSFVQCINRLDSIVQTRYKEEAAKDKTSQATADAKFLMNQWMRMKSGYIGYHLSFRRYKLATLLPGLQTLRNEQAKVAATREFLSSPLGNASALAALAVAFMPENRLPVRESFVA